MSDIYSNNYRYGGYGNYGYGNYGYGGQNYGYQNPSANFMQQWSRMTEVQKLNYAMQWAQARNLFSKPAEDPPPPPKPKQPDTTDNTEKTDSKDTTDNKSSDKKDSTDESKAKPKELSGSGSIDGDNFESADGEEYKPKVTENTAYNLLSDKGFGINGKYGSGEHAKNLIEAGFYAEGTYISVTKDGTVMVNGKAFEADKNDGEGTIKKDSGSNNRYTITSGAYEVEVTLSPNSGVKMKITGTKVLDDEVSPQGLWGSLFDDEKLEKDELKKIKGSDFRITDVNKFNYKKNNNIGDLEDAPEGSGTGSGTNTKLDENLKAWRNTNPGYTAEVKGSIGAGKFNFAGIAADTTDDASWDMTKLNTATIYNLFSDRDIQVGGKFLRDGTSSANYPWELGFNIEGRIVKAMRAADGKLAVTVDGTVLAAGTTMGKASLSADGMVLSVNSAVDTERWNFTVNADRERRDGLVLDITGNGVGNNSTRTSGLWGAFIGSQYKGDGGTNDANGAGFIRNADGALTLFNDSGIENALAAYVLPEYSTADKGFSVFSGYSRSTT